MGEAGAHMPEAEGMRSYAAAFVAHVTDRRRLPLDYSVGSLRIVDFLIDGLRKGGAPRERVDETLLGLGAYVGEVLVRQAGAAWVDFDADQQAYFTQPVGVRMPDGRLWNPLGKVLNRFRAGGPEESLQTFYLTLHGRLRRAVAADPRGACGAPGTGRPRRVSGPVTTRRARSGPRSRSDQL